MNSSHGERKVAIISGGTGYVGEAVARSLAKDGFKIALLYYKASDVDVAEKMKALQGEGHCSYRCNLENREEVIHAIEQIEMELGHIYACVHAAGVIPKPKQLHLSSVEDLEEQFQLNVYGSFNFLSACALRLKEYKEGVVIGITTAGVVTNNNTKSRGAYGVVKFAVQGMLVALKEELRHFGVRVYSVAPGFMEGGMNSNIPQAFAEMVKHSSPTKTITNANEVADKISFLCSPESKDFTDLTILMAPETGPKE